MTKNDLMDMFHIDNEAEQAFLNMPRNEQLLAILGMLTHLRNDEANLYKRLIDVEGNLKTSQEQQRTYRLLREAEDKRINSIITSWMTGAPVSSGDNISTHKLTEDELLTTTQKITKLITKVFQERDDQIKPWRNMFFGILQTVLTIIVLAVLYLAFGGKVPGHP